MSDLDYFGSPVFGTDCDHDFTHRCARWSDHALYHDLSHGDIARLRRANANYDTLARESTSFWYIAAFRAVIGSNESVIRMLDVDSKECQAAPPPPDLWNRGGL